NTFTVLVDNNNDGAAGDVLVVLDNNTNGVRDAGDTVVLAGDPNNDGTGIAAKSSPATVTAQEPAITVGKSVSPPTVDAGAPVTFTIVIRNGTGPNVITGFDFNLNDPFPAGFENVAVSGAPVTTGTVTGVGTPSVSGNTLSLSIGSMAPGSS